LGRAWCAFPYDTTNGRSIHRSQNSSPTTRLGGARLLSWPSRDGTAAWCRGSRAWSAAFGFSVDAGAVFGLRRPQADHARGFSPPIAAASRQPSSTRSWIRRATSSARIARQAWLTTVAGEMGAASLEGNLYGNSIAPVSGDLPGQTRPSRVSRSASASIGIRRFGPFQIDIAKVLVKAPGRRHQTHHLQRRDTILMKKLFKIAGARHGLPRCRLWWRFPAQAQVAPGQGTAG